MKNICQILLFVFLLLPFHGYSLFQDEKASTEADSTKKKKDLPLVAGRSFEFDLTEGSWISLDVSNDGKLIVFDFLGDIYTLPILGGDALQLTKGLPFDSQPRFSPDGKSIVYVSDESGGENVWTINLEDKKKKQITEGNSNAFQSPDWSPDGNYLIASKLSGSNQHKIWMYHIDGGSGTALITEPNSRRLVEGAFSPDGRYIWFSERKGGWTYNAPLPQYRITKYDRETGEDISQVSRYGSAFRPTPSPDGKWLVYGTRHDDQTGLILKNLKTGDEEWLAYPIQHDDQESRASRDVLPGISFAPDSKSVVVYYGGKIWNVNILTKASQEIPFRVKSSIELGPELDFNYPISDSKEFTIVQIRDVEPSPDGKQIVFVALDEVYTMDMLRKRPAKKLVDLAETQAQPKWSPDGKWISFVTWTPDGGKLYKVAPNGSNLTQLNKEAGVFQNPVWSNDGSKIVLIKGEAEDFRNALQRTAFRGTSDLIWIAANGSNNNFITYTNGRRNPHFIQGSERIYYQVQRD